MIPYTIRKSTFLLSDQPSARPAIRNLQLKNIGTVYDNALPSRGCIKPQNAATDEYGAQLKRLLAEENGRNSGDNFLLWHFVSQNLPEFTRKWTNALRLEASDPLSPIRHGNHKLKKVILTSLLNFWIILPYTWLAWVLKLSLLSPRLLTISKCVYRHC